MPILGVKSSFLKLVILAVQKRELIIEEVHIFKACLFYVKFFQLSCGYMCLYVL